MPGVRLLIQETSGRLEQIGFDPFPWFISRSGDPRRFRRVALIACSNLIYLIYDLMIAICRVPAVVPLDPPAEIRRLAGASPGPGTGSSSGSRTRKPDH